MGFSYSERHRIAYMAACRELSDRARGQVSTLEPEIFDGAITTTRARARPAARSCG